MNNDRIFNGVPADNIDGFFALMNLSDQFLPHTKHRISPIVFQQFMGHNNIMCLNQMQVYEAACSLWRMQLKSMPNVLEHVHETAGTDYNKTEEEHAGWCPIIDYLNRVMDIETIDTTYTQMHYLAHVCYLAGEAKFSKDPTEDTYLKALFRDCISPAVYPVLIPAPQIWTPIRLFTDHAFNEGIQEALVKTNTFIASHCGRTTDPEMLDKTRLLALHETIREALNVVHENKYDKGVWQSGLGIILHRLMLLRADMNTHEFIATMERDGCKCLKVFREINHIKKEFDKDQLGNDPEVAIDMLLDTYADIKKNLASYNIGEDEIKRRTQGVKV